MKVYWSILLVGLLFVGCARNAPSSLSPAGVRLYQANEVAVGLGTLQHAAIELNKVQRCDPAPCQPLLSDQNTRIVIEAVTDGLTTLRAVPDGWKATGLAVTQRIEGRLDAAGAKAQGTIVYSILYDTNDAGSPVCQAQTGGPEAPQMFSNEAMQEIASPGNFYNQPNPGQLNTIFAAIATDIGSGTSRLVDDGF